MTSDTKVGLLLGLGFIFIAAFVINGLPNFRDNADSNQLTSSLVDSQNISPGIGASERKISRQVIDSQVRFKSELPKSLTIVPEDNHAAADVSSRTFSLNKKQAVKKEGSEKPALSRFYIVQAGDSLSSIAVKFYGRQAGSKKPNVHKIFQANRRFLKSIDQIYPGQKLVIPAPADNYKTSSIGPGQRQPESEGDGNLYSKARTADRQWRIYIVRPDDSLWAIASEQLGDGSRYAEIARLNADVLEDEDCLFAGMRLKIPLR